MASASIAASASSPAPAPSTPSPPSRVHTPATPKHGYSDPWEPYSPRKSARISSQQLNKRTPSPHSSSRQPPTRTPRKSGTLLSTPTASPQKKRMPAMDSVRRASGALTAEGTSNAADHLGISPKPKSHQKSQASSASQNTGMLPTPAKTPKKQPNAKTEAATRAIARNLFANGDDSAATPRKKKAAKKHSGLGLGSFAAEEMVEDIPIFTDSRDRVPERDNTAENPFYVTGPASTTEGPPRRRSKRTQVTIPGKGKQTIEEATRHHEEGMVVIFRGKPLWRPFADADEDDEVDVNGADQTIRQGPIARSAIKPRLLFAAEKKGKGVAHNIEDEEAPTDIEDHQLLAEDAEVAYPDAPETPLEMVDEKPDTPEAPRFAPASPPTTARASRTGTKRYHADGTPMKKSSKPRSPFDDWRRSKSRGEPHGQKREGEALAKSDAPSKRQRA
ncbi:Uu.00g124380.m01.CDS01 [Anthostomella pinea]|uniref:Uu.00g124380.m01.CDS01 n=1 Tax=Anthostomella pinea TaxID=933095 RepID=A0AAI8VHG9_9PEZI|nr:Uu.00g124380.m01.CDS01 [Anthostomella pinea]